MFQARPDEPVIDTESLLRQEALETDGAVIPEEVGGVALYRALNALNRTALCISGGGIRSATFALGVIQALANHPRRDTGQAARPEDSLLGQFKYLSTVSGGGYIGSWLSAWLSRQDFDEVQRQLSGRPGGPDVEASPIEDLRRDSNYLTPKIGLGSADTWAAAAMVVRNLVLIWILVVSTLAAILLCLKLGLVTLSFVGVVGPIEGMPEARLGLLVFGFLLLLCGQSFTLSNYARPSGTGADQFSFISGDLLCVAGGAALLTTWAVFPVGWKAQEPVAGEIIGIALLLFFTSWLLSLPGQWSAASIRILLRRLWCWLFAGLAWGVLVIGGLEILQQLEYTPLRLLALAVLGPPWLLMAQITSETLFVALTSHEKRSDQQREWFARAAGWFAAGALGWTALTVLALLGSRLTDELLSNTDYLYESLTGGGMALAAGVTILGGGDKNRSSTESRLSRIGRWVRIAGGQIFLALLLVIISGTLDLIVLDGSLLEGLLAGADMESRARGMEPSAALAHLLFGGSTANAPDFYDLPGRLFLAVAITAPLAFFISRQVNINRFSLHDLYRNRLVRAYLGASHRDRKPNPFTGFDLEDNPLIHTIWPQQAKTGEQNPVRRLYHIVNCTLNVVSSRNLAWQQRKAMSFVVTPRHSGAADLCPNGNNRVGRTLRYSGAYRPSDKYGGPDGITLGTAMAISGAAANPNMGYNSSPSVTLLFALFNIRLGWWLGNPGPQGRDTWQMMGPRHAIVPWFKEAFGLTNAEQPYINLSDGGHFENLGLYEMVRRRCRFIVLSDAGCDPTFTFADLGNAVRKIYIDLGVTISFPGIDRLQPRIPIGGKPQEGPYCAIGHIHYRDADGGGEDGYILYIKPSYHGTEGAGIRAYASEKAAFPHDSTADQWFDEAQFESYRSLGFEIVDGLLNDLDARGAGGTLEEVLTKALAWQLVATTAVGGGSQDPDPFQGPVEAGERDSK